MSDNGGICLTGFLKLFRKTKMTKTVYREIIQDFKQIDEQNIELTTNIVFNEQTLKGLFQNCSDVEYRSLQVNGEKKWLLIYIDGLVDMKHLDLLVLKPLINGDLKEELGNPQGMGKILDFQNIAIAQTKIVHQLTDLVRNVLKGDVAILVDGESSGLMVSIKGWETRSLEEPISEPVVRGSREGFVENIRVNTGLIRRRLRSPQLKMESCTIGELSQTDVIISYIQGIVSDHVLNEVRKRVSRIQIDAILESGYIEEFIEDLPFSPFPQIQKYRAT